MHNNIKMHNKYRGRTVVSFEIPERLPNMANRDVPGIYAPTVIPITA